MRDEGPSPDDLSRFSSDAAYCPDCGEQIYDQAEWCPECGACIGGQTSSRPPVVADFRQRWMLLVIIIVLLAFLGLVLFF